MNEQGMKPEGRINALDDVMRGMFLAAKAFDPTRPVLDVSGWTHRVYETDINDNHSYQQDPDKFAEEFAGLGHDDPEVNGRNTDRKGLPFAGQPFFVSEFGGVWWNPDRLDADGTIRGESWGYGERPRTEEEFLSRVEGLCKVLLDDPKMFGYCYTQLTDVFQEENGIYRFDRRTKVDEAAMARIRKAQQRPAAIESLP